MAGKEIITIGREFGSGGHEVGRRLAAELGLKLYDKELLKLMAQESNICEQVLEDYDEKNTGSLLYSIMMDVYPSMNYVGNTLQRDVPGKPRLQHVRPRRMLLRLMLQVIPPPAGGPVGVTITTPVPPHVQCRKWICLNTGLLIK